MWIRSSITHLEKELHAYLEILRGTDEELLQQALSTMPEARAVSEKEIHMILDYCLTIKTLLKRKSVYPLKPGGLRLYQDLIDIKSSLLNWSYYNGNFFLTKLLSILSRVLNDIEVEEYVKYLKISYQWIYRTASKLKASECSENQAQQNLASLISSFDRQNDATRASW